MGKKTGIACMAAGLLLLVGSVSLLLYNRNEDANAAQAADAVLPSLQEVISRKEPLSQEDLLAQELLHHVDPFDEDAVEKANEMPVATVDGYDYIGYLSIPALQLHLPVMAEWDYNRLKIAPCRQFGTAKGKDLVIAAHNYTSHFGRLSSLYAGDTMTFTDMDGTVFRYRVMLLETLSPYSVDAVQNSEWDLTLYTCTYGGANRVTVRCILAE